MRITAKSVTCKTGDVKQIFCYIPRLNSAAHVGNRVYEKLCEMASGTADEYDVELKNRYKKFDPDRFSTRTINKIFKVDPTKRRELPDRPAQSEGMAEIFNEQVEALRQIEKRSKSRKK